MDKLLKTEKKIREKETQEEKTPSSKLEFEKALFTSPISSYLWIRYTAFALNTQGIQEARQVIQRALSKIPAEEEQERLNVHIAWTNLEEHYGDPNSCQEAIDKALASNNPEPIYRHQARKAIQKNHFEEAEDLLKLLCKKFRKNVQNWEELCSFYLVHLKDEGMFQETLRRGLQSLNGSLELEKRTALLEYKHGNKERARTVFEKLIRDRPKRADLWRVYIDMETKHNTTEAVRDLFERVLSVVMNKKNLKAFGEKYIEFETQKGKKARAAEIQERLKDLLTKSS